MRSSRFLVAVIVSFGLAAGVAQAASWYDEYAAGIKAVRAGQWQTVVQRMSAAIRENSKEENNARAYGAFFINYHPFYYRGVAYLNLGEYEKAVTDLEKTTGRGEINLGTIEELVQRAKAAMEAPTPVPPTPPSPVPQPQPQPQPPTLDPTLRTRTQAKLTEAKQRIDAARDRNATQAPQYGIARQQYSDADLRFATARSNEDLRAAFDLAERAIIAADAAQPPVIITDTGTTRTDTTTTTRGPTLPDDLVLEGTRRRVRAALESYFDGEYERAAEEFQLLTRELPRNPWIWAFLGASQYSRYAFEAKEEYRTAAVRSFQRAKSLRTWKDGLPEKYFSRRIRRAFERTAG